MWFEIVKYLVLVGDYEMVMGCIIMMYVEGVLSDK